MPGSMPELRRGSLGRTAGPRRNGARWKRGLGEGQVNRARSGQLRPHPGLPGKAGLQRRIVGCAGGVVAGFDTLVGAR